MACRSNNARVLDLVRIAKPSVVVLSAIWQFYSDPGLTATVAALKEASVGRVVVLGLGLTRKKAPARFVLQLWREDPLHRMPSPRLDYGRFGVFEGAEFHELWRKREAIENAMRKSAQHAGAQFVSLLQFLCKQNDCLMRASSESGESFYIDTGRIRLPFAIVRIALIE
nr:MULTISPECIES: SGNH hydrolase domain-containing protein [unclassified Variovorax]